MRQSISASVAALPIEVRSFSDYFDSKLEIDDLAHSFGYQYEAAVLSLPQYSGALSFVESLQERISYLLTSTLITSEISKREFLIAPLLQEIAFQFKLNIRSEYAINISPFLRGSLDYLLQGESILLVVEAKREDLTNGFKQLMAELVALDQWKEPGDTPLYGAVSVGVLWQFAVLNRAEKHIVQDINLFRVPADLYSLAQVLAGVLHGIE